MTETSSNVTSDGTKTEDLRSWSKYRMKIREALGNLFQAKNTGVDCIPASPTVFTAILIFQVLTVVSTVFDIFVARQVLGFLFLTLIPGFLILKIAKVKTASLHSTLLLSVGTSVLFLMLTGLILNTVLPIFGVAEPLSSLAIILAINLFVLTEFVILFATSELTNNLVSHFPTFSVKHIPLIITISSIPIITLIGVQIAQITNNSIILMLLVVLTSIMLLGAFSKKFISPKYYPLIILVIAFFLLFHISLISPFLIGYDVHMEAYFSQLTFKNAYWNPSIAITDPYNAMISITILPVVYSNFLNYDLIWVLKVIFPLLYLFVPLTLYFVYRKQTPALVALLGVFFFMSMDTFFVQMLGLTRQMIGELFLVLGLLLIVEKRIGLMTRRVLLVAFSFGIIISHYSIAYLFLFLAVLAYTMSGYFGQIDSKNPRLFTGKFVLVYVVLLSFWYLYIVPGATSSFATAVSTLYNNIVYSSAAPGISGLLPTVTSPIHRIAQYLFYFLQITIVIGIIELFFKHRKSRFAPEYSAMAIGGLLILFSSIALPSFAASLNISRFYHFSLILLAPLCITGGIAAGRFLARGKMRQLSMKIKKTTKAPIWKTWALIVVAVIICVFLFQVGFIYEITGDTPTSISLSTNQENWSSTMLLLDASSQEISGCQWILQFSTNVSTVYADVVSNHYLYSYGLVPPNNLTAIYPGAQNVSDRNSLFFFGKTAIEFDKIYGFTQTLTPNNFTQVFNNDNQVYSSGDCAIYIKPF